MSAVRGDIVSKRQIIIKLGSVLPAAVLGILFNYYVTMDIASFLVGYGEARSVIFLFAQVLTFYSILQFIIFRIKYWTRVEIVMLSLTYIAVIIVGLVFRSHEPVFSSESLSWWFSMKRLELNPFSFVSDFLVDRHSIIVAMVNLALFIPLPFVMHLNRIKPRLWIALILFIVLELLQPALAQGFFSLGDITLYSIGYGVGFQLLNRCLQRMQTVHADN